MTVVQKVPNVTFKTRVRDESVEGPNPYRWEDKTTADIFGGKKVVVFSLPGAFTPTCSLKHLPGFIESADAMREKGVDMIGCVGVNDAFVMDAWGQTVQSDDKVTMLADGSCLFTQALGVELDLIDKAR